MIFRKAYGRSGAEAGFKPGVTELAKTYLEEMGIKFSSKIRPLSAPGYVLKSIRCFIC